MILPSFSKKTAGLWPAVFALGLASGFGLSGCSGEPVSRGRDTYVIEGSAFGTYYVVKVVEPASGALGEAQLQGLRLDLERELADVDAKISGYRPDSEISHFNAAGDAAVFSPESFEVLQAALEIAGRSGGAFDPTVGPLVEAWGFGPRGRDDTSGRDDLVSAARLKVGFQLIELDAATRRVAKKVPGMHLDLSAIGEGHAIDRLTQFLASRGFENVLVELGGEARARGRNAEGGKWRIGIERPNRERGSVQKILELGGEVDTAAIATSGDYRKYYEQDGKRLSHLIDPRSARPIEHKLASVSVVAASCRKADAWATALMVLGPEEGLKTAEAENLAALFLVREGELFVERSSSAFSRLFPPR